MHWVYVLMSSTTGAIYVGETVRLYRRWNEHRTGRGGVTTSSDNYDTLIGLYRVGRNWQFLTYRPEMLGGTYKYQCERYWDEERDKDAALRVENHITERYRLERKKVDWWNVRGGKYCSGKGILDIGKVVVDRPLCKCGYPCEVNIKQDKSKLYFTCPVPEWTAFEDMHTPVRCSFWEEFEPYRKLRDANNQAYFAERRKHFVEMCNEITSDDFLTTSPPAPV